MTVKEEAQTPAAKPADLVSLLSLYRYATGTRVVPRWCRATRSTTEPSSLLFVLYSLQIAGFDYLLLLLGAVGCLGCGGGASGFPCPHLSQLNPLCRTGAQRPVGAIIFGNLLSAFNSGSVLALVRRQCVLNAPLPFPAVAALQL